MICKLNKKYVNEYYKEESDAALRRQIYYVSRKLIIHIYKDMCTPVTELGVQLLKTKLFSSWVEMRALNKMFVDFHLFSTAVVF